MRTQSNADNIQNESIFLLVEDDVWGMPNMVSSRITEKAVDMELKMFQQFFDKDGWKIVKSDPWWIKYERNIVSFQICYLHFFAVKVKQDHPRYPYRTYTKVINDNF